MKYYLVSLKYNKNSNKTKIRNVKKIDLDGLMMESEYESIPVIAYESYSMYSSYLVDVLSGKKIYSETEDVEGLKYTFNGVYEDEIQLSKNISSKGKKLTIILMRS